MSSQIKIGYDIDGCLACFSEPFTHYLSNAYNQKISSKDIYDYSWWKCFAGMTEDVFWRHFHEFGKAGHYRNFPLFKDAAAHVTKLLEMYDYHFVTSRPDYTHKDTLVWLENNFGIDDPDKITFCRNGLKSDAINELDIDIFIEDAPHHAQDIVNNTPAYLYLMDAPYNKDVIISDNMTRVYNWEQIAKDLVLWEK